MIRNRDSIVIREFDASKDSKSVEDVERRCEVGPSGKLCLFTDLLGDPICRVRNSPAFLMLVWYSFCFFSILFLWYLYSVLFLCVCVCVCVGYNKIIKF